MKVSSDFDSGNVEVVDNSCGNDVQLNIRKDTNSTFFQWFYFCLFEIKNETVKIRILNAGSSSFPEGWHGYEAFASYDRESWFRVSTCYSNGELIIEHCPERSVVYYAYFPPYSYDRHLRFLAEIEKSKLCKMLNLGSTIDGRSIDLVRIGVPSENKKNIWIIARQHPGETMAEWFVEGAISRLLDGSDPVASEIIDQAVFYMVPNMNPDGSVRGNLRTNSSGINLNREWNNPTLSQSPEVFYVRNMMEEVGVDLFLDIHGDEVIPYNFVSGCAGNPSYNERIRRLEERFKLFFSRASYDFQDEHGYPEDEPNQANLSIATKWVGNSFDCLSFTLEMPFKNNAEGRGKLHGWSSERSMNFGKSILNPISCVIGDLR